MLDLHKIKIPKLKDQAYDRSAIKKDYLRQNCKIAVKNLIKNKNRRPPNYTNKDAYIEKENIFN